MVRRTLREGEGGHGVPAVAIDVGVRDLEEATDVSSSRDHARWVFGEGESFFLCNLRRRMPAIRTVTM